MYNLNARGGRGRRRVRRLGRRDLGWLIALGAVVPVTCGATDTFSSFWAGLDGDGTPTVEQTGTEADCANGAATYQGWYEIFPNAPVIYPNPVRPGDAMSASVASAAGAALATPSALTGGNAFSVTADNGTGDPAGPGGGMDW